MTAGEQLAAAESLSTGRPSWSHQPTVVDNSVDGTDVSTGGATGGPLWLIDLQIILDDPVS
ncbi:hypothetical protein A2U01_0053612 [Trifolium medium]|uniref:Uncharacterized protein n=1 Tax=Trifolium medium TaxID=97028 RepID=A0A392R814_9FABA|nr:hypothetical protein [Trifolium medium]